MSYPPQSAEADGPDLPKDGGILLTPRSRSRLAGVHGDLVAVVVRAAQLSPIEFQITEGVRSLMRQRQLVVQGASRTLRSRHLTGHAVDVVAIVDGHATWDEAYYKPISEAFKAAANELGVAVEWGGDWRSFQDTPHFQLAWKDYPAADEYAPPQMRERDVVAQGSRIARHGRTVRRVGLGVSAASGALGLTSLASDALDTAETAAGTIGRVQDVGATVAEHAHWLIAPGRLAILGILLGIAIGVLGARIVAARVEDANTGKTEAR